MAKLRVILVDDHTLFRGGLKGLLERSGDVEVVGEASDGEEFLRVIASTPADVVFMDFAMEPMSGDEATQRAIEIYPDLKIITLSMFGDESYYTRMVTAGAKGFLLKNSEIKEVLYALRCVAEGGEYFSAELLDSLTETMYSTRRADMVEDTLSARETEILIGVCRGQSNQEIADELYISKRTVDKHRANIMEKTGCRNTASLVIYAIKNQLVDF
ncbi:MAG: response regulator transcription factor [Rikenellaceae bacterium]